MFPSLSLKIVSLEEELLIMMTSVDGELFSGGVELLDFKSMFSSLSLEVASLEEELLIMLVLLTLSTFPSPFLG